MTRMATTSETMYFEWWLGSLPMSLAEGKHFVLVAKSSTSSSRVGRLLTFKNIWKSYGRQSNWPSFDCVGPTGELRLEAPSAVARTAIAKARVRQGSSMLNTHLP